MGWAILFMQKPKLKNSWFPPKKNVQSQMCAVSSLFTIIGELVLVVVQGTNRSHPPPSFSISLRVWRQNPAEALLPFRPRYAVHSATPLSLRSSSPFLPTGVYCRGRFWTQSATVASRSRCPCNPRIHEGSRKRHMLLKTSTGWLEDEE